MTRVTNAVAFKKKRKKLFKQAKGFFGDRKNHARQTKNAIMRSLSFNYEHRKKRKSDFRQLWIVRIGVAAKINGISYSKLIQGLNKANISLDRKMLADLAANDAQAFAEVAGMAKIALAS